jgi:glycosyltransferase involved in cell wall biosynthesis
MTADKPLVDFLIPQFQDPRIIRAIRSITHHPEADRFRIILLDGGRDATLQAAVAAELRSHDIHRIAPDKGIYDALNTGLDMATAPWIGWIGSDDLLASTFSGRHLADAPAETAFVAFTTLFFNDADGAVLRVYRPSDSRLLRTNGFHLPHFSTFIRAEVARTIRFDIHQRNFADQLYMHELEAAHHGHVVEAVSTLMCAGGISNSSSSTILRTNAEVERAIATRIGPVRSKLYVGLKLLYKVGQTIPAKLNPTTIAAYRSHVREDEPVS